MALLPTAASAEHAASSRVFASSPGRLKMSPYECSTIARPMSGAKSLKLLTTASPAWPEVFASVASPRSRRIERVRETGIHRQLHQRFGDFRLRQTGPEPAFDMKAQLFAAIAGGREHRNDRKLSHPRVETLADQRFPVHEF